MPHRMIPNGSHSYSIEGKFKIRLCHFSLPAIIQLFGIHAVEKQFQQKEEHLSTYLHSQNPMGFDS